MSTAAAKVRAAPATAVRWSPDVRELGVLVGYFAVACLAGAVWLEFITRPDSPFSRDLATPLWTIAVGIATNASCAILGCYLVLRRMSLLGDAVSHAVLPGIVLGFYYSQSTVGWPIFLGAIAVGVLTAVFTQGISSLGRVSEDASMGVVFTSLFALGVVLINSLNMRQAHIDADCLLYGTIDLVSTDRTILLGWEVPRTLRTLVPMLALVLIFVTLLWKELKIVAFDPALAAAMGFRVALVHYLLMGMVAGVSVASFEAVGSILVVAMLIVPAAAAALMTDRLKWMLAWAVTIGAVSAIFGYLAAAATGTSVAGMMAAAAGIQFALAVFLSPKQGLITRWLRNLSLAVRIAAEDVIARLYRGEERGQSGVGSRESGVGDQGPRGLVKWLARLRLARRNWVNRNSAGELQLTETGRAAARNLVRAHRLWETYLDTHFDLPRDHLHDAAERMEHFLDPQLQEELATELADRAVDPHGKSIPPAASKP
jgi:ABC-type Mn2+/Zn2+ transport system permease subunit